MLPRGRLPMGSRFKPSTPEMLEDMSCVYINIGADTYVLQALGRGNSRTPPADVGTSPAYHICVYIYMLIHAPVYEGQNCFDILSV